MKPTRHRKTHTLLFHLREGARIVKFGESSRVSAKVMGGGAERGVSANGDRVSVWEEEAVLELDGGDGSTKRECTQ